MMIKGLIYQEDKVILNIYAFDVRLSLKINKTNLTE